MNWFLPAVAKTMRNTRRNSSSSGAMSLMAIMGNWIDQTQPICATQWYAFSSDVSSPKFWVY